MNPDFQETVIGCSSSSQAGAGEGTSPPSAPDGGRYELRRVHASGGLGQVWLARDRVIERDVAFKKMRPDRLEEPALRARFLREARVTGQLEHPGIVPVYDLEPRQAGGSPSYVMRFIQGRTLKECIEDYQAKQREGRAGPLDLQKILSSFLTVLHTMAYAHSRGVVHRDLKGENVLVGEFGEVVVLDWGLAKVLPREGGAQEPMVVADVAVGDSVKTAEPLMEPLETVAAGPVRGGTNATSSCQTLPGQILGTPSFMSPEQVSGQSDRIGPASDVFSLGGILFLILTGRPPFPGADAMAVLEQVRLANPPAPHTLNPSTPRALSAVCLKALSKQISDRYPTAKEMADEIERFLADAPVLAYPEPWTARALRWARRHRTAVTAGTLASLTALLSLSIGLVLLGKKNREIGRQRTAAVKNFTLARSAVDQYLTQVSDSRQLKQHGLEPLRRRLLTVAEQFYSKFVTQGNGQPELRDDLGAAQLRLGNIRMALGANNAAEESYQQAIGLYDLLTKENPTNAHYPTQLAAGYSNLGMLYSTLGRTTNAEAALRQALAMAAKSRELSSDGSSLGTEADAYDNLGILYDSEHRLELSAATYERGLAIRKQMLARTPRDEGVIQGLVRTLNNLGTLYGRSDTPVKAEPYLKEALPYSQQLVRAHPQDPDGLNDLAGTFGNLAGIQLLEGDFLNARTNYAAEAHLRRELIHAHPEVVEYHLLFGSTECNLGELSCRSGVFTNALPFFNQAVDELKPILQSEPRHATAKYYLSYTYGWRSRALAALGRVDEALADLDEAMRLDARRDPSLRLNRANLEARQGKHRQAWQSLDESGPWKDASPGTHYQLAVARAWCLAALQHDASLNPAERIALVRTYGSAAVADLTDAERAGYFKTQTAREALRHELAFNALATEPAFQALLSRLSVSQKGNAPN